MQDYNDERDLETLLSLLKEKTQICHQLKKLKMIQNIYFIVLNKKCLNIKMTQIISIQSKIQSGIMMLKLL